MSSQAGQGTWTAFAYVQQLPSEIAAMHAEISNTHESQTEILSELDKIIEGQAATKSSVNLMKTTAQSPQNESSHLSPTSHFN